MRAGKGNLVYTWSVLDVKEMPKEVGIEFPLRRKYEGKPYTWDKVEVTEKKLSLDTAVMTDDHTLTLRWVWWQKEGVAEASDGLDSMFLDKPAICIELTVKQTKSLTDPKVDDRFRAWTAKGKQLAPYGTSSTGAPDGQFLVLVAFYSDQPQPIRLTWTPIYAKDTGKKFVFSGITVEPLGEKR